MIQTLYRVTAYKEELINPAIKKALDALLVSKDLRPGMKVVLKPNLLLSKEPSFPAVTHPLVIKAVAEYLRELGIEDITLAESSGGIYSAEHMKAVYQTCGMKQLEPLVKLNTDFSARTVNCPDGFTNHSFHLLTPVCEADYVISICKLKTHAMTGYSGGIKNLFGTVPGLEKPQLHYRFPDPEDFSHMLLELSLTVSPQVTVIDAIEAMEGNGPSGGTPYPMHLLFASRDLYTQDVFAAGLMGMDPMSVSMLRKAVETGLARPEEMELIGDPVPEGLAPFRMPDTRSLDFADSLPPFLRAPFRLFAGRLLKSYPQVDKNVCIGCGKCAESCPAHIIKVKDKKAHFQKKGCISCFCCQEMCPVKAISVRKAL